MRRYVHATGADLLYRDGQYLRAEYDGIMGIGGSGPVPRLGWGHSCIEDVIDMATSCRSRDGKVVLCRDYFDPLGSLMQPFGPLNWVYRKVFGVLVA